jgi:ATP-dependent Clp protease ATP-binding subunit ClpB
MTVLRQSFLPEFLNRIDDVVFFHALGKDQIARILDIQLRGMSALLKERSLALELTPAARAFLAEEGYDPVYGARPLKRTLQRQLQNPLASAVLKGDYAPGDTVVADVHDDAIVFRRRNK